jgi:hypothetical protein
MKAIEDLPRDSGELHRHAVEQWLGLARTNKDSFVATSTKASTFGSAIVAGSSGLRTGRVLRPLGPTPWRPGLRTGGALLGP